MEKLVNPVSRRAAGDDPAPDDVHQMWEMGSIYPIEFLGEAFRTSKVSLSTEPVGPLEFQERALYVV